MLTVPTASSRPAMHQLDKTQRSLNQAIERLSSGLRVNSARDDAAGLSIGNRMEAQIRGTEQARRNTNDGASMTITAEGALSQINDHLQRIRELSVQGLNGTLSGVDNDAIQQEINLRLKDIDRINTQAQFNGQILLDGSAGTVNVQIGVNDGETLGVDLNRPGFSVDELGLEGLNIAGTPDTVSGIRLIRGTAQGIPVADATYSGVLQSDSTLLARSSTGYDYGAYVKSGDAYYVANIEASHYTIDSSNSVSIFASDHDRLFRPVDDYSSRPINDFDLMFKASDQRDLSGSDYQLVKTRNQYYIQQGNGVDATYREADVTHLPPTIHTQASDDRAVWPPVLVTHYEGMPVTTMNTEFSGIDAKAGEASLMQVGEQYYIRTSDVDGQPVYQKADVASDPEEPDILHVTARNEPASTAPVTQPVAQVDGQPVVGSRHVYQDSAGGEDSLSKATLTQDGNNQYYLEQNGRYYAVTFESVTGDKPQIVATVTNETPILSPGKALTREMTTVSGTSYITLDPRNVSVSYTDNAGREIEDALRLDDDGNYFLKAANQNGEGYGYRSATLVDSAGRGTTLLKTRTGSGDVPVYYVMEKVQATTTVPMDKTQIRLREVDPDIRIKVPNDPLAALDRAIARVDDKRSMLGATQNRMSAIIDQQGQTIGALSEARSRIMDADYAVEVSNMSRAQITQQAGTAVLAQANQRLDSVLALLR